MTTYVYLTFVMMYMGVDIVTTVSCFKTWWECGSWQWQVKGVLHGSLGLDISWELCMSSV